MAEGSFWSVLLALACVVMPLLLAWLLIVLQVRPRPRGHRKPERH